MRSGVGTWVWVRYVPVKKKSENLANIQKLLKLWDRLSTSELKNSRLHRLTHFQEEVWKFLQQSFSSKIWKKLQKYILFIFIFCYSQGGTSLGAPIKVEKIGRSEISYPIFLEFILTLSDTKYRFVKNIVNQQFKLKCTDSDVQRCIS